VNLSEVAMLLGTVTSYDLRIEVSELKVRAWFESLDDDMPLDEARKLVFWYYSNFDAAISPSAINREWRRRRRDEYERNQTRDFFLELDKNKENKASPESVKKYLDEIRSKIGKPKDASVESDRGQVAPDL
jgi:hypothetical protein